jgi:hypothetical protein
MEATMARPVKRRRRRQRDSVSPDVELDAMSIETFCRRNNLSKPFYFKLRAQNLGPEEIRLGARVLITKEAAEKWRRERAKASKRASSATAQVSM